MKALIALTGAVIVVVGTVAYAAPVAAQPGTVRVTFAEWCATRPLGGIDELQVAGNGQRPHAPRIARMRPRCAEVVEAHTPAG